MMKISKCLAMLALVGGLLTSCDTDNESTIYTPQNINVSFAQKEPAQILTADSAYTIPVRIVRADARQAYTAHYTFESADEGIFTDENQGAVTFNAGEGAQTIYVKASNMVKGNKYSATLTLSDDDIAVADTIRNNVTASTTVSIMCDYNWVKVGTGTFTDNTFTGHKATKPVEIRHAEGTDIYRIVTPYLFMPEADEFSEEDVANFDFHMDDKGNITVADGIYDFAEGYQMYYDTKNYPDNCNITNDKGTITWNFLLLQGTSLYNGGNFVFEWTNGYPIK